MVDEVCKWEARQSGWAPRSDDARDGASVDYARIIHSASFRRLQGKTQILNLGESDFYRTRLTHSMEVAQIAGSVTRQIEKNSPEHDGVTYLPSVALVQAIGLTHDLGHPPFGHGGEVALNFCMRAHGGFEGNGQTLRILARLEKFSKEHGADLMRRTLLGALKYPAPFSRVAVSNKPALLTEPSTLRLIDRDASKPPKCFLDCEAEVVDWLLEPLDKGDRDQFTMVEPQKEDHAKPIHKSLDCSIMDVADDIAYGVHDLEDALAMSLISKDAVNEILPEEKCGPYLDYIKNRYPNESKNDVYGYWLSQLFGSGDSRKHSISRLVHYFVTHCELKTIDSFEEPLVRYRVELESEAGSVLKAMKGLVVKAVIKSPSVQQLEFKGQRMVVAVYETFLSEPHAFLPRDAQARIDAGADVRRAVCDYVSGMSDTYLLRMYERLFSPRIGSVFDRL